MAPQSCPVSSPVLPPQNPPQNSRSSGDPPRHPLPGLSQPHIASQPLTSKGKRKDEREKGKKINSDDWEGVDARWSCTRCTQGGHKCRVPRNPAKSKTYKCGKCLSQKLGCDLNINNPGVPYDENSTEANRGYENRKAQGRQKAAATKRRKAAEAEAKKEGSA
ncbi:hypothetical protein F5Y09DRAFT_346631 [Xylaria sp. FL1042]|nr:hypothetical protein F5Y09DRAFT_346631 [Xylaria sp. FL1042]